MNGSVPMTLVFWVWNQQPHLLHNCSCGYFSSRKTSAAKI